MVVNVILGLLDLIAAVILLVGGQPYLPGSGFAATMGVILLLKGAWFAVNSAGAKDWIGFRNIIDMISGVLLIMIFFGIFHPLFAVAGALMLIKGAWYLIEGLIK